MASISKSLDDVASSAQAAISNAVYGTSTGSTEGITSAAANAYASVTEAAKENIAAAGSAMDAGKAQIKEAMYGPEQGAVESASARLAAVMASAKAKIAELSANGQEGAVDAAEKIRNGVKEMASNVSSAASAATGKVKDEL